MEILTNISTFTNSVQDCDKKVAWPMLACGEGVAIIKSVTGWQYPIPEMSVCLYPSWE